MADILLNAEPRNALGGSTAKQLRVQGRIPGVIYGHGEASTAFHVKELDLRSLIYTRETHIVKLIIGGQETRCILRDAQFDPITDRVTHIDFLKIHKGEKIKVDIPITLAGSPQGVKDGGILDFIMHKLTVNVDPDSIPDHIEVNVADLKIGQSVHVRDLPATDAYVIIGDENAVIAACVPPKVAEEVVATAATEIVEPEQIQTKGKKDEEEGAPEGKKS
jgi:large subunit ribosomal protein L25